MTPQILDQIDFNGETYQMFAEKGEGLFYPRDYNLPLMGSSTACWHGYVCKYVVVNDYLKLDTLETFLGKYEENGDDFTFIEVEAPIIFGVVAERPTERQEFNAIYRNMNVAVSFTGKLILVHESKENMFYYMSNRLFYEPYIDFELTFNQGKLILIENGNNKNS
jgi:hypothetical protein